MNYEKKYKEALERARQVHSTNMDENKKSTEYIFPELAGSEDERIRKALIQYFEQHTMDIGGIGGREAIAWLEKQGEQKPTWSEKDEKFAVDTINFLYREKNQYAQTIRLEGCIAWLKSLKEKFNCTTKKE